MSEATKQPRETPAPPDLAEQLRRFNEQRKALLQGKPISGDERIPGPYSGVGGDVPPGRGA